jgi:hypothetical protein
MGTISLWRMTIYRQRKSQKWAVDLGHRQATGLVISWFRPLENLSGQFLSRLQECMLEAAQQCAFENDDLNGRLYHLLILFASFICEVPPSKIQFSSPAGAKEQQRGPGN